MTRIPLLLSVVFAVLCVIAASFLASAEEEDHGHGATPATGTPSAVRDDSAVTIRSLTPEEIAQIEQGQGAGLALPAELNGVPGPRHVLDLADDLGLSPEQMTSVQAVYDRMQAAVIPAGRRYLDARSALEEYFRAGTLTEADLPARVAEVYRLEGELAAAHLDAHLKTAEILTPDQVATYNRLRGGE